MSARRNLGGRYRIFHTTVDTAGLHRTEKIHNELPAAEAIAQLHAAIANTGASAVVYRWDGAEITRETIEYFDIEPVPYDDPNALIELIPLALAARWTSTRFTVGSGPTGLQISWTDGPTRAAVKAFTTQQPGRPFHAHAAGITLIRAYSTDAWSRAITIVESTYGCRVPRLGAAMDAAAAAEQFVDVPIGAAGDSSSSSIRHSVETLVRTHLSHLDLTSTNDSKA